MRRAHLLRTRGVPAALVLGALGALVLSPLAETAGPRPTFQLPHPCGQTWRATTYADDPATSENESHWPSSDSIDLRQSDTQASSFNQGAISQGEPVLASAAGTVLEAGADTDGKGPDKGNYVFLDHGGDWYTHYVHLDPVPSLTVGQKVAAGEQIGRVGKTGGANDVFHLHYTQASDAWDSAVRSAFNGSLINTHAGNMAASNQTSANCPSNAFLQVDSTGRYQLIYKPGTGAVKIMKVGADGAGATSVWSATWSRRWTHFTPFAIGTTSYYFAYKSSTGEVDFDRVNAGGVGVKTVGEGTWSKGLTHFIPFALGGKPYFVAYDSANGGASVNRINGSGNGASILVSSNWGKGWTHFAPFVQAGTQYFLAYRGGTGTVEVNKVTGSGNSATITEVWSREVDNRVVSHRADGSQRLRTVARLQGHDRPGDGHERQLRREGRQAPQRRDVEQEMDGAFALHHRDCRPRAGIRRRSWHGRHAEVERGRRCHVDRLEGFVDGRVGVKCAASP